MALTIDFCFKSVIGKPDLKSQSPKFSLEAALSLLCLGGLKLEQEINACNVLTAVII